MCKFCEFTGATISNIIQHHKELHADKIPPFYKCDHCVFYSEKNKTVKKHSTKKHGKKLSKDLKAFHKLIICARSAA